MAEKNKVKYGLRNVHYAKLTIAEDGTPTYGEVQPWPGAVSLGLDAEGDTTPFYADNTQYYVSVANNGYSGDFESALVPDTFSAEIMGQVKDAKGVYVEDANIEPASFALLFEFQGDKNAIRRVLYNCKMARAGVESETTEDSREPTTETGEITASPLMLPEPVVVNGQELSSIVQAKTAADTDAEAYGTWYQSVHLPVAENPALGALTVTSAAGAAAGTTKLTVSPNLASGNMYRYKIGNDVAMPAYDAACTTGDGWQDWDGTADITAATGNQITVVELTTQGAKARKGGSCTVTAKNP